MGSVGDRIPWWATMIGAWLVVILVLVGFIAVAAGTVWAVAVVLS